MSRLERQAAIAAAMPRARQVSDELGRLLGDKDYFGSDQLSLADFIPAQKLDFLAECLE